MREIIYLPHRIGIVNLRQQHVVQGLRSPQKYRPGKEAVSYYYNYDLYNKMAYRLWVEPTNTIVLQQMKRNFIPLSLSLLYWGYHSLLIRIILRQKSVEEMKEDFTHNITQRTENSDSRSLRRQRCITELQRSRKPDETTELSSDYPNPAETAQRTGGTDPFHEYGATEEFPSEL